MKLVTRNRKPIKEIILDMDSSDCPAFGRQEGSAYNVALRAYIIKLQIYIAALGVYNLAS